MDPLSIAVVEFSRSARDAAKDLSAAIDKLHALSAVLDPIARCLTATSATTIPQALAAQVDSACGDALRLSKMCRNIGRTRS